MMIMSQRPSIFEQLQLHAAGELELEEAVEVGHRFREGFGAFLQEQKRRAVTSLLREEFPHLSDDRNFIEDVISRLSDEAIEEQRFVFLSLNPNLNATGE